jgi:chorismate-pyruvate lyase
LLSGAALADQPVEWRDTPVARLEALALIQTLNAQLLAGSSATLTLERWCKDHALADPAVIVARRIVGVDEATSAAVRSNLQVSAEEPVRYRRVELRCGTHLLSIADNWYVPGRLRPEMNELLQSTQTPFGKVVLPLRPHRATLALTMLWSPLAEGWEQTRTRVGARRSAKQWLRVPEALFEHHAVLYTEEHRPIAELHEVYQRGILEFAEPLLQ